MPSSYESWGRVAIEAAVNGIPVIAAPTAAPTMVASEIGVSRTRSSP